MAFLFDSSSQSQPFDLPSPCTPPHVSCAGRTEDEMGWNPTTTVRYGRTYKQHGDVLVCNGTVPFSCVQIWFSFTGLPVRRHNSAELLVRVLLKRSIVLTLQVHSMNESVSDT
mgnify:CR=1 FL=1